MSLLSIDSLFSPATVDEWKTSLLSVATKLALAVTSWQSGQPTRTIFAVVAEVNNGSDQAISRMIQGGFLDFAALPTVTPDPSVTPGAPEGWLDLLGQSFFDEERFSATFATGSEIITNITGSVYGPYGPGQYHVSSPLSSATYSNTLSLTIAAGSNPGTSIAGLSNASPIVVTTTNPHGLSSGAYVTIFGAGGNTAANGSWQITVIDATHFALNASAGNGVWASSGSLWLAQAATIGADQAGVGGTAAPGTITNPVTDNIGVTVTNLVSLVGAPAESNLAYVARCRLKLASLSPNGPHDAYNYFALVASLLLSSGMRIPSDPAGTYPVVLLSGGAITRTRVDTDKVTGIVHTTIANAAGPVSGVSGLAVIDATNAAPIVVQTAANHGLTSGDFVTIDGVLGNLATNGTWQINVTAADKFELNGSTGNGAYTAATGGVEGGDLGEVDVIIQANAVPDGVTAITQSAVAHNVAVVADVFVPVASLTGMQAIVDAAIVTYFAQLAIGGISDPNGAFTNVVPFDAVLGAIFAASPAIKQATLTLNGTTANVQLLLTPIPEVAVLSPAPVVTVHGI
jgi:hypothetical protein